MEERSEQTHEIVRRDRVTITAVVATYNEEEHIGRCLMGLLRQQDAGADVEIVVVDGMSTDRTVDVVRSFPEYGSKIRLLQNPRRLDVYAWNAALCEAHGEYFAMIVAHAEYGPTYFASCLDVMKRTGATAVGGVQRPIGKGLLGGAIAWCMSSPFGVGNARFRYTRHEEETDSVFSIFTRCSTLREAGGYDERLLFDEESDMNYRLRGAGGKLVVSPLIEVRYRVRQSLRALRMQMYRYGYWRWFVQIKHPRIVPMRAYAPGLLIAAIAFSGVLAMSHFFRAALLVPVLYGGFLSVAALCAFARAGTSAVAVPLALMNMHFSYGIGWWAAVVNPRSAFRHIRGRNAVR